MPTSICPTEQFAQFVFFYTYLVVAQCFSLDIDKYFCIIAGMKIIRLYGNGEGCQIPENKNYLMVSATQLDASGEWMPTLTQSYDNLPALRDALQPLVLSGDGVVIRGSNQFEPLADELGLPRLTSDWGCL